MLSARDRIVTALVGAKLTVRRWLRRRRLRYYASDSESSVETASKATRKRSSSDYLPSANTRRDKQDVISWLLFTTPSTDAVDITADQGARHGPWSARMPKRSAAQQKLVPPICIALFVVSLLVRGWRIAIPAAVVFDEFHFGKFVKAYWTGEFYFDIHPPLGKLILYAVSRMASTTPMKSEFPSIGTPYRLPGDSAYIAMRWSSAVFGSCSPPLTFLVGQELGWSPLASLVPAFAIAFDHLNVVESRLILMDAQLLAFSVACLLCALRMWGSRRGTRRRLAYLLGTAVFGSLALSVKWTALATPAIIALLSISGSVFPSDGPLMIEEMGLAGFVAVSIYVLIFYIHLKMLPLSGRGDRFMLDSFQATLRGSENYDASASKPWFLFTFGYLNVRMLTASANIKARHKWESKWYQWIIAQRGVLYHSIRKKIDGEHFTAKVYLIANPVIVFAVLIAICLTVLYSACFYIPRKHLGRIPPRSSIHSTMKRMTIFLAGYLLNLLPYIVVERCTFLYHYVPALFYGELILANAINAFPPRAQGYIGVSLMMLSFVAFVVWSPWIYSYLIPVERSRTLQLYTEGWA